MPEIKTIGIVGTGVIGAGWAARFLAHGFDVIASDPHPKAETRLRTAIDNAWPALEKVGVMPSASRDRLRFAPLEEVCAHADFIQESAPEDEDIKRALHQQMASLTGSGVILASSSSGLLPSRIQEDCTHPERILIGHPFNPVYLLPLVEVVAGKHTAAEHVQTAIQFYRSLAMHPLHVRHEIEGYISDRLQEALWREALHLVNDGIATTEEIDDAVIYGPGLRWALMGTCLTFHLAGGEQGMRHMLAQFGPALKLPWTKLVAPELSDTLIDRMVTGTQAQAQGQSIKELETLRDDCLIGIMRTLQSQQYASGKLMTVLDGKRYAQSAPPRWQAGAPIGTPLTLFNCTVSATWIDYNGHMTEASYLTAFGEASDALFRYIGIDEAYRNSGQGHSFYTVETHINYYQEVGAGESLHFTTQILGVDTKRLHFFHCMYHSSGDLLAATEQMLLHVDMQRAKAAAILPEPLAALEAISQVHKTMPPPKQMGRHMTIPSPL